VELSLQGLSRIAQRGHGFMLPSSSVGSVDLSLGIAVWQMSLFGAGRRETLGGQSTALSLQPPAIKSHCPRGISPPHRIPQTKLGEDSGELRVALKKGGEPSTSAELHPLQLWSAPTVQLGRAHKGHVHAQATMYSCTVHAEVHAMGDAGPCPL